jgi:hypothetical protein
MASNGYTSNGATLKFDPVLFTTTLTNPADPVLLIDEVLSLLYSIDVSQAVKDYLLTILLSGQTANYYWTNAWDDYMGDPTDAGF